MTECNTHYIFEGDASEIIDLHYLIAELKANMEMDCSGHIADIHMPQPTILSVEVITKHKENITPFATIMHQYPSVQCYFSAQNTEIGYYVTNDYARVYFPERYIINYAGEEPIECNSIEKLYREVSYILGVMTGSMDHVVESVAKHNDSHSHEEQMRVSEVQMADDLVNFKVKTLVQRMEMFVGSNSELLDSASLYRDMRFVAQSRGEAEFVWAILPTETKLYKWDSPHDWGVLLAHMDQWQKENAAVTIYHHRNILTLSPRSSEEIKREIFNNLNLLYNG